MYEKTCYMCSKAFISKDKRRMFCGITCFRTHSKAEHLSKSQKVILKCVGCHKEFEHSSGNAALIRKYCNRSCWIKNHPKTTSFHLYSKGKTIEEIHGIKYAINMRLRWSKLRKGKPKSVEHRLAISKAKTGKGHPDLKKECFICKKSFVVPYGKRIRVVCGVACRPAYLSIKAKERLKGFPNEEKKTD